MDGPTIVRELVQRGYDPIHAAALAGHALQESGGDPTNVNQKEDAHGLLQWRLDRWKNLQDFARQRGVDPTDPQLQLDFIGREFAGPEAAAGKGFLAAGDLSSASAALKPYIRFGDNSDEARLNNARGLLGQASSSQGAQTAPSAPLRSVAAGSAGAAPEAESPDPAAAVGDVAKRIAAQDLTPAPAPIAPAQPMLTPQMIRARQLAQAMLSRSLNPTGQM